MQHDPVPAPAAKLDNLFGICHRYGEIFGFNPLYLRIALMVVVLANFEVAMAVYLGAGALLLVASLAAWRPRAKSSTKVSELVAA